MIAAIKGASMRRYCVAAMEEALSEDEAKKDSGNLIRTHRETSVIDQPQD